MSTSYAALFVGIGRLRSARLPPPPLVFRVVWPAGHLERRPPHLPSPFPTTISPPPFQVLHGRPSHPRACPAEPGGYRQLSGRPASAQTRPRLPPRLAAAAVAVRLLLPWAAGAGIVAAATATPTAWSLLFLATVAVLRLLPYPRRGDLNAPRHPGAPGSAGAPRGDGAPTSCWAGRCGPAAWLAARLLLAGFVTSSYLAELSLPPAVWGRPRRPWVEWGGQWGMAIGQCAQPTPDATLSYPPHPILAGGTGADATANSMLLARASALSSSAGFAAPTPAGIDGAGTASSSASGLVCWLGLAGQRDTAAALLTVLALTLCALCRNFALDPPAEPSDAQRSAAGQSAAEDTACENGAAQNDAVESSAAESSAAAPRYAMEDSARDAVTPALRPPPPTRPLPASPPPPRRPSKPSLTGPRRRATAAATLRHLLSGWPATSGLPLGTLLAGVLGFGRPDASLLWCGLALLSLRALASSSSTLDVPSRHFRLLRTAASAALLFLAAFQAPAIPSRCRPEAAAPNNSPSAEDPPMHWCALGCVVLGLRRFTPGGPAHPATPPSGMPILALLWALCDLVLTLRALPDARAAARRWRGWRDAAALRCEASRASRGARLRRMLELRQARWAWLEADKFESICGRLKMIEVCAAFTRSPPHSPNPPRAAFHPVARPPSPPSPPHSSRADAQSAKPPPIAPVRRSP